MDTIGETHTAGLDAMVAATPATRDRAVDLLRAVSIAVVVLWHWVFSITHWRDGELVMANPIDVVPGAWLATWVLQIMPLFFIVGGFANAASLASFRRSGRSDRAWMRDRLERLARPTMLWLAVVGVFDLASVSLAGNPSVVSSAMVVFVPLWFLAAYAVVTLLAPVTTTLHARRPAQALVGLLSVIVVGDIVRSGAEGGLGALTPVAAIVMVAVFVFCHQLGYVWHAIGVQKARPLGAAAVGLGLVCLALLTNLGPYPASMVAVRGVAVSNMFPTTAAIAALGLVQFGLVLLGAPALRRLCVRPNVWKATIVANANAMTIFCWHMTALAVIIWFGNQAGIELGAEADTAWWLARPVWFVLPLLILGPLVACFGRFERGSAAR